MTATAGSVKSIAFDGRSFAVPADAEINRVLGGYLNEVSPNGNQTNRLLKTAIPGKLDNIVVEIDNSRKDQEYLQGLADGNTFFPVTVEFVDGSIYSGQHQITSEVPYSNSTGTATLSTAGSVLTAV